MKTTIFNDTTKVFNVEIPNGGKLLNVDLGKTIMLDVDGNGTSCEYVFQDKSKTTQISVPSNELCDWAAITFYMTPEGFLDFYRTKKRPSRPNRQVSICIHIPHCMYNGDHYSYLMFCCLQNHETTIEHWKSL